MQRVDALFTIEWGNKAYHSKGHLDAIPGDIPLIASGDNRTAFGTHGFYEILGRLAHIISVASTGSAGATYYRGYPCDVSDDALILAPRAVMTERQMIWYQEALRAQRFRWSYGRKVTPDKLGGLLLPNPPYWLDEADEPADIATSKRASIEGASNQNYSSATWHKFRLAELFTMELGGGISSYEANEVSGDVPFVGAAKTNNAVVAMTGAREAKFDGGKLALVKDGAGAVGLCFYQPTPFVASSHVMVLTPRGFELDGLSGVFMAHVISQLRSLFSYGRALTDDRVTNVSVRLPSDDAGLTPSTNTMIAMMRSLPFSAMFADKESDSVAMSA